MKLSKLQATKRFQKLLAKALREGMEEQRRLREARLKMLRPTRKELKALEKELLKLKEEG